MKHEEAKYCLRCGAALKTEFVFGEDRPVCPSCGRIHFYDPKLAVQILVERGDQVLLVKRGNEPQIGFWTIPGGYVDAWEDPAQAAERECLEETGITARVVELLGVMSDREFPRSADILISYRAEVLSGEPQAGDDATEAGFFPRSALPPLAFRATRVVLGLEAPDA